MNFLHHRGGGVNSILTAPIKVPWCGLLGCICLVFLHYVCPQSVCPRGGIVTLVAFVWPFCAVHFQMFPQIACSRRGIIALVAFVWLFSTVFIQMPPQIAWLIRCKVTLVAFVWLFSTVRFQMCPQSACKRGCIFTLVALIWLHFTFSNVSSNCLPEKMRSHICCICLTFLHCAYCIGIMYLD